MSHPHQRYIVREACKFIELKGFAWKKSESHHMLITSSPRHFKVLYCNNLIELIYLIPASCNYSIETR